MSKRRLAISCAMILLIGGSSFGAREIVRRSITFTPKGLALFNVVAVKSGKDDVFRLKDTSYNENTDPFLTDMTFAFARSSSDLSSDDTGRYPVIYASYQKEVSQDAYGGSAARFF
ncbi:MAG TPA: hypothetical protein VF857_03530, partial [Spirochaetota bacterium]